MQPLNLQPLDRASFSHWITAATVLKTGDHGPKVLQLPDGSFLKLYRRRRLLSTGLWLSSAERFANNARGLQGLGIPVPRVLGLYQLDAPYRSVVHYQPLPGLTFRELLQQAAAATAPAAAQQWVLHEMAGFIRRLHDLGIYFRAPHPGNLVRTQDQGCGLIDFSDLRRYGRPLSLGQRQRNIKHIFRNRKDWAGMSAATLQDFVQQICPGAEVPASRLPASAASPPTHLPESHPESALQYSPPPGR